MDSPEDRTPKVEDQNLMIRLRELLFEKERAKVENLTSEVAQLEEEIQALHEQLIAKDEVVPIITDNMGDITKDAVSHQRNKMAKALSPIIGEATRYQIQESREEMVEALYPIVGAAVSRAVGEALNDLRKRIDQQIRPNQGGVETTFINRLRGVDPADIALRNALPFQINQLFLIQHDSGLVLEFVNQNSEDEEINDSDLVSSMLTAIRSFVNDSFSPDSNDDELYEVYFGDDRIIIESGTVAYAAAVISGIEPEGFRSLLRAFVNELHIQHKNELEEYDGDPENKPDLIPLIDNFIQTAESKDQDNQSVLDLSGEQASKMARIAGVIALILLIGFCLFYGFMTYRLLPYAFTDVQRNPETVIIRETSEPVVVVVTATPNPVEEEPTPLPQPIDVPFSKVEIANAKWSRTYPDSDAPQYLSVASGTTLTVLKVLDDWVEAEWEDAAQGQVQGWIKIDWVGELK